MDENRKTAGAHGDRPGPWSAVADRVATRSRQLSLSEPEVAFRAGMSVRYLYDLLAGGRDFDADGLTRLAAVLGTTSDELLEGRADPPPGQGPPAPHPVLVRLTTQECWDRLGTHGIGRIGLSARPGPLVLPVNYTVDGRTVVYRTNPAAAAAPEPGSGVSFETDHIDEERSSGWSVLLVGHAEAVTDPETVRRLDGQPGSSPWAGGRRDRWIRVLPEAVSGRVIRPMARD
jgi:transcriptional regulator with XRE-family HTH domain